MNANIRTIGGSIGTALASSVIACHVQPSGLPGEAGFTDTFLLLSAFADAAVVLALAIPSARRTPVTPLTRPSEEQLAA